jgi:hypothetical protein
MEGLVWQQGVVAGLKKRMESYVAVNMLLHGMGASSLHQRQRPRCTSNAFPAEPRVYSQATQAMEYGEPADYGYFGHGMMPVYPQVQSVSIDPWMWDPVMEDVNMFNM